MTHPKDQPETYILQLGSELGFAMTGIAPALPTDWQDYLDQWFSEGKHGEMSYLADHREVRNHPSNLLTPSPIKPSQDSRKIPREKLVRELPEKLPGGGVICVIDRYASETELESQAPAGKIARYAWGDDYHKVLKKRLMKMADKLREQYPDEQFRVAVDTAPILEREQALRAGLGWIGKHTLLIHPKIGSWFVLGEIVTTLKLTPTVNKPMADHCGTCTRCIDACPTNCITPYQLDATRCISYLTLEHRSEIDPELHPQIGDWLAGCDICQEVCPHPRPRKLSPEKSDVNLEVTAQTFHERYTPRPPAPGLNLLEVLNWTPESRQQAFMGSALKRMKLEMVKRNALIAAGNHLAQQQDHNLRERIDEIAQDESESEMVRNTAKVVMSRLDVR